MNAHSFEHQLRQATAPAPDAEAQLRSRNAALAEFQRIHAAANQTISPKDTWVFRLQRLFPGTGPGRPSRPLWLGGLATACVVVVAVSTFFLVPPGQRQVPVRPGIETVTIPEDRNPTRPPTRESEQTPPAPGVKEKKIEVNLPNVVIAPAPADSLPKARNSHRHRTGKPAASAEAITTPEPSVLAPASPP